MIDFTLNFWYSSRKCSSSAFDSWYLCRISSWSSSFFPNTRRKRINEMVKWPLDERFSQRLTISEFVDLIIMLSTIDVTFLINWCWWRWRSNRILSIKFNLSLNISILLTIEQWLTCAGELCWRFSFTFELVGKTRTSRWITLKPIDNNRLTIIKCKINDIEICSFQRTTKRIMQNQPHRNYVVNEIVSLVHKSRHVVLMDLSRVHGNAFLLHESNLNSKVTILRKWIRLFISPMNSNPNIIIITIKKMLAFCRNCWANLVFSILDLYNEKKIGNSLKMVVYLRRFTYKNGPKIGNKRRITMAVSM